MSAVTRLLSEPAAVRLGLALLHLLWQGALVAVVVGVALRLMRRRSANARYLTAGLGLLAVAALPIVTYLVVQPPPGETASAPVTNVAHPVPGVLDVPPVAGAPPTVPVGPGASLVAPAAAPGVMAPPAQPPSPPREEATPRRPLRQRVMAAVGSALPYVVAGWLLGVALLALWRVAGWRQVRRLARRQTHDAPERLRAALSNLADRLRVSRPVRLLASGLATVPTVIGWLRPVVLLPAAAVTGLAPEEIEALLAHELAHIRRHDYLVNTVQVVTETLLFHHPAVWWLSGRMRTERENCCDDLAVSLCGDRATYARALATMEELRAAPSPAAAASGGRLLDRIHRLAGHPERCTPARLGWLASALAVAILATAAVVGFTHTRSAGSVNSGDDTVRVSAVPDAEFARGIRLIGVQPIGSDDLYDTNGTKIGTCVPPARSMALGRTDERTGVLFVFELPPTDEVIFPPFAIPPEGVGSSSRVQIGPMRDARGARRFYIGIALAPFTGREELRRVAGPGDERMDVTLRYYHGPRREAALTFAGPFWLGQPRAADRGDISLWSVYEQFWSSRGGGLLRMVGSAPGLESEDVRYPLGYDASGSRYLLHSSDRHTSFSGGIGRVEGHVVTEGIPPEGLEFITFGEPACEKTFRNVRISFPQQQEGPPGGYAEKIAQVLGAPVGRMEEPRPVFTRDEAVKVIDLVRGEHILAVEGALRYGRERFDITALDGKTQRKVRAALQSWVGAPDPQIRQAGAALGLLCEWPEFVAPAFDLLEAEDWEVRERAADAIRAWRLPLTDDELARIRDHLLDKPDHATYPWLMQYLGSRDDLGVHAVLLDLAAAPDACVWAWWPAMKALIARGELLGSAARLPAPFNVRKEVLRAGEGLGDPVLGPQADMLLETALTVDCLEAGGDTFREVLRCAIARLGPDTATGMIVRFLQEPIDYGRNGWAVDRTVKWLNRWHNVNLGGLGRVPEIQSPDLDAIDWRGLVADVLEWRRTGVVPGQVPPDYGRRPGDLRVIRLNPGDLEQSLIGPWVRPAGPAERPRQRILAAGGQFLRYVIVPRPYDDPQAYDLTVFIGEPGHSRGFRRAVPAADLPCDLPIDRSPEKVRIERADAPDSVLQGTRVFAEWQKAHPIAPPAQSQPAWGEAVDGVQVRLRAQKREWKVGEVVTFLVDVRNRSEKPLDISISQADCLMEYDGQRYRWTFPGPRRGRPRALPPGEERERVLGIGLLAGWGTDEDEPLAVTPGRHTVRVGWPVGEERFALSNPVEIEIQPAPATKPVDLSAGGEGRVGPAQVFTARLPSGVTVELLGVSQYPDDKFVYWRPDGSVMPERPYDARDMDVTSRQDPRLKKIQLAFRLDGKVGGEGWEAQIRSVGTDGVGFWAGRKFRNGRPLPAVKAVVYLVPVEQRTLNLDLDVAAGPWKSIGGAALPLSPANAMGKDIRFTDVQEVNEDTVVTVHHPLAVTDAQVRLVARDLEGAERTGSVRNERKQGNGFEEEWLFRELQLRQIVSITLEARPYERVELRQVSLVAGAKTAASITAAQRRPTTGPAAEWGDAVDGVQVRLRAERRAWRGDTVPVVYADVRNRGTRDLMVWRTQVTQCELQVDGRWYGWSGEVGAKSSAFPPGREYTDISITLVDKWHTAEGDEPLRLSPGRHTIRVAFTAQPTEKDQGQPVRAVSNPVEIEISPSPATGPAAGGEPALWGPVREQVLTSRREDPRKSYIDLDSGRVMGLPQDVNNQDRKAVWEWAKQSGADAVADCSTDLRGLLGFELGTALVDDADWDRASADQLNGALAHASFKAYTFPLPRDPFSQRVMSVNTVSTSKRQPRTFAFRTREGAVGILQFLDYKDDPGGFVKFRYKVLQGTRRGRAPATEGAKAEEFPWGEAVSADKLPQYGRAAPAPGSVEGRVLWGGKPRPDQEIWLDVPTGKGDETETRTAKTDTDGCFRFTGVPAGRISLTPAFPSDSGKVSLLGLRTEAEVKGGRVTEVTIGGRGRTVICQPVMPADLVDKVDWAQVRVRLQLEAPTFSLGLGHARSAFLVYSQFLESDLGRAYSRAVPLGADGIVRIDGVPSGRYFMQMVIPNAAWRPGGVAPRLKSLSITVPPMPGGESEEPLNAGALEFQLVAADKRIFFRGLDLTQPGREREISRLPDLWVARGGKSYELDRNVRVVYVGLDGTVYHRPDKNAFYVQCDPIGSGNQTYYGPFPGDPATALALAADEGAKPAAGRIIFLEAAALAPTMSDTDAKALAEWRTAPVDEDVRNLARRFEPALRSLSRVRDEDAGVWGVDFTGTGNVRFVGVQGLVQAACLRARVRFADGQDAAAFNDLYTVLLLGRKMAKGGRVLQFLIGEFCEQAAIEGAAAHLVGRPPTVLRGFQARLRTLPPPALLKEAFRNEFDGSWRQFERWMAETDGADTSPEAVRKRDETIREARLRREFDQEFVGLQDLPLSQYPEAEKALCARYDQALAGSEIAAPARFGGIRPRVERDRVRFAMLQAALASILDGPDAFRAVKDPHGDGPFDLTPLKDGAFELRSKLSLPDSGLVGLRVGLPAAASPADPQRPSVVPSLPSGGDTPPRPAGTRAPEAE